MLGAGGHARMPAAAGRSPAPGTPDAGAAVQRESQRLHPPPTAEVVVPAPEIEDRAELSAQHLIGETLVEDGVLVFRIHDGEQSVEISHEIGDANEAARRVAELGNALHRHAETIRYRAGLRMAAREHGPLNGPGPWTAG
jgi:hypothetical protein